MSFWRKFAHAYFDFCVFIAICCSAIAVGYAITLNVAIGIICLFVAALLISIGFCAIGMFMELCDNIADIKDELHEQNISQLSNKHDKSSSVWICSQCNTKNSDNVKKCRHCGVVKGYNNPNNNSWHCYNCGTTNTYPDKQCKKCGMDIV